MRSLAIMLIAISMMACTTSTDPDAPDSFCEDTSVVDATGTEVDESGFDGVIHITQFGHGVGPLWGTYTIDARFEDRSTGRTVSAGGLTVGEYVLAPISMESGAVLYTRSEPYEGTPQDAMVPVEIGGNPANGYQAGATSMYIPPQFDVEINGYDHGTGHRDTISLSSDLELEWDPGTMTDAKVTVTLAYETNDPSNPYKEWSYTYQNEGECTIPASVLQDFAPPGATFNLWLRRDYVRCVNVGGKHLQIHSKSAMYTWVRTVP